MSNNKAVCCTFVSPTSETSYVSFQGISKHLLLCLHQILYACIINSCELTECSIKISRQLRFLWRNVEKKRVDIDQKWIEEGVLLLRPNKIILFLCYFPFNKEKILKIDRLSATYQASVNFPKESITPTIIKFTKKYYSSQKCLMLNLKRSHINRLLSSLFLPQR